MSGKRRWSSGESKVAPEVLRDERTFQKIAVHFDGRNVTATEPYFPASASTAALGGPRPLPQGESADRR